MPYKCETFCAYYANLAKLLSSSKRELYHQDTAALSVPPPCISAQTCDIFVAEVLSYICFLNRLAIGAGICSYIKMQSALFGDIFQMSYYVHCAYYINSRCGDLMLGPSGLGSLRSHVCTDIQTDKTLKRGHFPQRTRTKWCVRTDI